MTSLSKTLGASGFLLALGVAIGAFGAHLLKGVLSPERMATWQTAVQYQVWNILGVMAIVLVSKNFEIDLRLSSLLILFGIFVFSGSLYLLCLTDIGVLGMITPIGGVLLIIGWGLFSWKLLTKN